MTRITVHTLTISAALTRKPGKAHRLNVGDHQILVADGPANQADAVVTAIDRLEGKYAAEDMTIGVPDPALMPYVESKLKQFHLDVRWGPGRSLQASPPFQWLRLSRKNT